MNFTHKTPLLPAHVGTTLLIETTADQPKFNIQTGGIVTGETATIDWGDGASDDFTRIYNANHTYAKPGIYRIEISDVLSAISIAVADAFANYAAMVKAIKKIHFAAENEAAITASATYQADPHLGAPSAEVRFDL